MIQGINVSGILIKHLSCECKCRFDGKKCHLNQWWNNDKWRYECKKIHKCEKDYVWNPTLCNWKNGKHLASSMNKIISDEIINIKETNFNEKI